MARSRRKHPFIGISTAASEKDDKTRANRRLRRHLRQVELDERTDRIDTRPHDGDWVFAKDGRRPFDPAQHPGFLRK